MCKCFFDCGFAYVLCCIVVIRRFIVENILGPSILRCSALFYCDMRQSVATFGVGCTHSVRSMTDLLSLMV